MNALTIRMPGTILYGEGRAEAAGGGNMDGLMKARRWAQSAVALLCLLVVDVSGIGSASAAPVRILAFGDSLTAGLGVQENEAFPARLQTALNADGREIIVENAGVSGDTSAGGLARLDWTLAGGVPDLVILELGANDGLRGLPPDKTEANLDAIMGHLHKRNIPMLLVGMLAPPNMGREYGAEFRSIYPRLAEKYDVTLYPFFLEGVFGNPEFMQKDNLHPNPQGVDVVVTGILPYVRRALKQES